ncbi:MAG: NAD(P)/FAD-dependent oxidoreductase [Phycisphaerales bacterium JB040]
MVAPDSTRHDVAIIGGGPSGSTAATLLKKYNPKLSVLILEKETFPRDHIGESQLPTIGPVLHEMGVWDKVEAAGFPVKIGASYTWGKDHDRWNFDFIPVEQWTDPPRPGRFEGVRRNTAFQVDRAVYDDILLRHAQAAGVEVRENTQVREIRHTDGRIDGLTTESVDDNGAKRVGSVVATHYLDASGAANLFRRALALESWQPEELRNIAFWDYWTDAQWAVEIGSGATRIQIRSLPYGWMWFIPISQTRTSIGLVCPVEWYRSTGRSPEDLYAEAIRQQKDIAALTANAARENKFQTIRDWSSLVERPAGPNWFLAGEAAGFADPILSAGMTIAHTSAREAAYTILELEWGEMDDAWLRDRYAARIRDSIRNHIRFAQYWYAANSCFTDLKEHCAAVAKEAGLKLTPDKAWRWLSLGGFTSENIGTASLGSFGAGHARRLVELFDEKERACHSLADGFNVFKLQLAGAREGHVGVLEQGRIRKTACFLRADRVLPRAGVFGVMVELLERTSDAKTLSEHMSRRAGLYPGPEAGHFVASCWEALEVMVQDGWVARSVDKTRPVLRLDHSGSRTIRTSRDERAALAQSPDAPRVVDRLGGEGYGDATGKEMPSR